MRFVKEFLLKLGLKFDWLHDSETLNMYTSIEDLPTSKWWKINKTHDYTLLLKDKTVITDSVLKVCQLTWDYIDQQHIERFGISKEFQDYWRSLKTLYIKMIKSVTLGGSHESHYEYAQIRFDAMYKGKKENNYKLKSSIERALNLSYRIDPNTMPIIEFSSLLEQANEVSQDGRD